MYISISLSTTILGYVSDLIAKREWCTKATSRRIFESLSLCGAGLCFACIPLAGCNIQLVIILLFLAMICYGGQAGGDAPMVMDIAPDYSGSLYGVTNSFGSLPGFLAPMAIGFLLDDKVV